MHPSVARHRDAIRDLAREYGVTRLEVFGSVCTPEFDPERSDVDFIVEYPPDYEFGPWLTRYFELRDRLGALLGRPADLVMAGALRDPDVVRAADETRQLLYAA